MSKVYIQILKKRIEKKEKYFKNYYFYCKKIKEIAEKILGKVQVFVFGSIIKNQHSPLSDIDVLIISNNLPERYEERVKIKTDIKSQIDSFAPFQIHLATPSEYNNWYKKFIKNDLIVIE